jgi:hypothetical protein
LHDQAVQRTFSRVHEGGRLEVIAIPDAVCRGAGPVIPSPAEPVESLRGARVVVVAVEVLALTGFSVPGPSWMT